MSGIGYQAKAMRSSEIAVYKNHSKLFRRCEVAGGVRCREDVAQRRGYSDRSNAAHSTHSTALRASSLSATGLTLMPRAIVMLYVNHVQHQDPGTKCVPSLQLAQAFGLPTVLAQAPVRNWVVLVFEQPTKNWGRISIFNIVACPGRADSPFHAGAWKPKTQERVK